MDFSDQKQIEAHALTGHCDAGCARPGCMTRHYLQCTSACCNWPAELRAQIGDGKCPRCRRFLDDHRFHTFDQATNDLIPLYEPMCPAAA